MCVFHCQCASVYVSVFLFQADSHCTISSISIHIYPHSQMVRAGCILLGSSLAAYIAVYVLGYDI